MKRFFLMGLGPLAVFLGGAFLFLFAGEGKEAKEIQWGVNFSKRQAEDLGLDWRAVYTALFDELKVKRLKVSLDWDELERQEDEFFFSDSDWLISAAEERYADLLIVVGMKTTRWPECHIPDWAKRLSKKEQQQEILELLEAVVERYKSSSAVRSWQVENEPLFPFGECPWRDRLFVEKEIELVKSLDESRPVVVSDSGEFSFWFEASRVGDRVGITMYRKVWFKELGRYLTYPLRPVFYARKALVAKRLFGADVLAGELQAEPWGPGKALADTSIEEQDSAFDLARFRETIAFAKQTGLSEFYLWGAEWWYWRKEAANDSTFWREATTLFRE